MNRQMIRETDGYKHILQLLLLVGVACSAFSVISSCLSLARSKLNNTDDAVV